VKNSARAPPRAFSHWTLNTEMFTRAYERMDLRAIRRQRQLTELRTAAALPVPVVRRSKRHAHSRDSARRTGSRTIGATRSDRK